MSPHFATLDSALLDRLVDGELAGDDYRRALALVEVEPEGWRRLALAFLEAQAWRREVPAAIAPPAAKASPREQVGKQLPADAPAMKSNWLTITLAVALLLAVGCAALQYAGWIPTSNVATTPIDPGNLLPSDVPLAAINTGLPPRSAPDRVKVTVDSKDAEPREFEVPVVEVYSLDAAKAAMSRSAITPEADQALELTGVTVHRRQQYLTVELEDGRQMVVPVEQVELVPKETEVAWQ